MRLPQFIIGVAIVILLVLVATPRRHPPRYLAATESTLRGTVTDVRDFYCPISGQEGTHLMVATANGSVEVHVAPSRFLAGQKWEFFRGDPVEVLGSKIVFHGHDALIARTIVRRDQIIALRDVGGRPLWTE
jgi:hypothetical protein